jgi:hypothetical protein
LRARPSGRCGSSRALRAGLAGALLTGSWRTLTGRATGCSLYRRPERLAMRRGHRSRSRRRLCLLRNWSGRPGCSWRSGKRSCGRRSRWRNGSRGGRRCRGGRNGSRSRRGCGRMRRCDSRCWRRGRLGGGRRGSGIDGSWSGSYRSSGDESSRSGRPLASYSCGGFPGLLFVRGCRLRGGVGLRLSLNGAANFLRNVHGDGTGMSLFLRDSEAGEKVDNGLRFDFELAGQLVNSNLIGVGHALRLRHL